MSVCIPCFYSSTVSHLSISLYIINIFHFANKRDQQLIIDWRHNENELKEDGEDSGKVRSDDNDSEKTQTQ
jgi:hypothetical protein